MHRALAGGLLVMALVAPAAAAEPDVTPQADRLMWCASAFFWLANSADDAGDAVEAELYDGWAAELIATGTGLLEASGLEPDRIEQIIAQYDQLVLDELAGEQQRYDVALCSELVAN